MDRYAQGKYAWVNDWTVLKVMAFLGKEKRALALLEDQSKPLLKVAEAEGRDAPRAFYVGTHVASPGQFSGTPVRGSAPGFNLHRDPQVITRLALIHGLPVAAIEGWQHWRACVSMDEN